MLSNPAGARVPIFTSTPQTIAASQLSAFTAALEAHLGRTFPDYRALHEFSIREFRTFWAFFLQWSGGQPGWSGLADPVCVGNDCEHARFFPGLELNYADSLLALSTAAADAPALAACHVDGATVRWTRGELRDRVARLAQGLASLGLRAGDRVAAVMRNDERAVVAALAVTAVGATLSTAAPEMGVEAILDRFGPLAPRLLLAHTAARAFDGAVVLEDNVAALASALPSLEGVVRLDGALARAKVQQPVHDFDQLISAGDESFAWDRFAFNHPLFIMFSSGTTGRPKCIVHGAGGTLLEHLKEHRLHTDLRPGDRMYFHTSCAWMMWNWQLSALASGVEIVTYDGPISTVDTLWRIVASERVTVFGTSPPYLRMCEDAGLEPGRRFDLASLRAILSTGSVLYDPQFAWVRDRVKAVPLQSISGGTDILGCFVLGNPNLPVYAGEAQCRSLGLDVQAWADGAPTQGIGELVCTTPFPSRPLGFFADPDGSAFHRAYFSQNPGVWTHGDLIEFSAEGTARLHGRSDGILNVRGIKVAPGEIYRVLKSMPEISDAMVIEQRRAFNAGSTGDTIQPQTVLLLVLRAGLALTSELIARVRRELARRLSPAHVPDRVVAVDELPVTHSGKLSETAARDAVNGQPGRNATALRNPGCLEMIRSRSAGDEAPRPRDPGDATTALERQLRVIWEKRFAFAPIACDDNFFELGGNSLLAAHLLADVERLTGRALPLACLFQAPTIRLLAALVEKATLPSLAPMAVLMRAGTGAPVFLVHGLSGSVMECWALVGTLKSPRPVYGLQARGLDGEAPPQERVEDIAESYLRQIRAVQPAGSYALVGYSFGGLVAFEMARQLELAGERPELLCLLDSYVQQDLPWADRVRHHYARARRKLDHLTPAQRLGFLAGRVASAAGALPTKDGALAMSPAGQKVYAAMTQALAAYRPQPYRAGPVLYLRAEVQLGNYYDPMPVWRSAAQGGLTIVDIPGEHLELVGRSAPMVAAALDRALATAAPVVGAGASAPAPAAPERSGVAFGADGAVSPRLRPSR